MSVGRECDMYFICESMRIDRHNVKNVIWVGIKAVWPKVKGVLLFSYLSFFTFISLSLFVFIFVFFVSTCLTLAKSFHKIINCG